MNEEVSDINEMLKVVNNIQVIKMLNIKGKEQFLSHIIFRMESKIVI